MAATDAKQKLLDATIDYVAEHGVGDLSLRQLAAAIDSSHRMIIYHFGSKAALLVEVARTVEQRQRDALAEVDTRGDERELMWRTWKRFADPKLWPNERLFFELYGQALQGRGHTTDLLENDVEAWVQPVAADLAKRRGFTAAQARAEARLRVAVVRGLLLDLLATGDRRGVDRAMERFIEMSGPESVTTPARRSSGGSGI